MWLKARRWLPSHLPISKSVRPRAHAPAADHVPLPPSHLRRRQQLHHQESPTARQGRPVHPVRLRPHTTPDPSRDRQRRGGGHQLLRERARRASPRQGQARREGHAATTSPPQRARTTCRSDHCLDPVRRPLARPHAESSDWFSDHLAHSGTCHFCGRVGCGEISAVAVVHPVDHRHHDDCPLDRRWLRCERSEPRNHSSS